MVKDIQDQLTLTIMRDILVSGVFEGHRGDFCSRCLMLTLPSALNLLNHLLAVVIDMPKTSATTFGALYI
jgi:hypothetical protein